ncbi:hypothetical protein K8B83_19605 [Shewanella inventionis]|uniref:hypothetical protein n=1 Tax=Shewanella inventionis TaxID=1738770 RepID=UPI0016631E78|nr:hypothetical protein [Shewanella inventionis]MCL1158478.1 hypothetical protein [Shewanella inventionis]UAL45445.1 hypothetical protein K8B83_19605 [Shewanella inventionis]
MAKVKVKQEEALSIKFSHQMAPGDQRTFDLYFYLPTEMGIGSHTLDEEEYYHSGILGRRSYYSKGLHLPLVQSRFISLNKRTLEEFRLYLNLFAYQFAVAIETDGKELRQKSDANEFYPALDELSDLVIQLLKKFRRNEPSDPKWKSYFEHADNYLSWFCEQQLLKTLAYSPRSADFSEVRDKVLSLCRSENHYREQVCKYNSLQTQQDANRISNKMLLLRRLIQQGVVLKEELKPLGVGLKKFVTGLATGLVMLVVSALIIKAQGFFNGLTLTLLLTLAVIYGFREIFKEDFRNAMWRFIQRGRPRWSRILRDTTTQAIVAKQLVWLEFMRTQDIPKTVAEIMKQRHSQNKVDSTVLHYRIATKVANKPFEAGYSQIQEQVNFSLVPFARHLERGKAKIYKESDGNISNESVERRYQVNLVAVLRDGKQQPEYARFKVTMNRSNIVEIIESKLPDNIQPFTLESESNLTEETQVVDHHQVEP